ncbi:helix-turn-helix transcriptional regulator [Enterococcus hulanensis]|uniref:Helix-turn-helix transcriptional regulator n=1 Tax=Enterococcus hulanensis TaxID=2559929 RepID=A0ABU3F3A1_9ENTE|nr:MULTISPECIES: helix-turn-helix transcriptional regulator [Enterococcus]MBX8937184.1 helix-turn-helix transcriptional regulator [Enterococcus gilvus]MDT2601616.1 helix-turn-helix transcriptional regulator [Enterococcus hulanensis]MDT2609242.1 helix-turn-helix transcriptional regulator [Enterococcus hulanensis]MDT2616717.1 helix-turn-helix transcriptional regulator [Enterococcus hulanensis]MDT2629572.1 helix-turn-helix transcriptional regulator [Enterococcus hulanensis]
MTLGNNFFNARKKQGLSQEEVAEKLGVSRQTISKWELDETLPDINQSKKLAAAFKVSLDELIEFDPDLNDIKEVIAKTSEEKQQAIDWTNVWAEKYPVLAKYQQDVRLDDYIPQITDMLKRLKKDYGYNDQDAFLVFKDILAQVWKNN